MELPASIAKRTDGFTGREWVFRKLNEWFAVGDPGIFLLKGAPGTGKSTLAARLVQMSNGIVRTHDYPSLGSNSLTFFHFCQAGSSNTLDPLSFTGALSLQLANRYQLFATALAKAGSQEITINASPVIGTVGSGAEVKNVVINDLHISNLSARIAFDQLVRRPLEQLCKADPHLSIILLVDALDEALTYDPDENIVSLLSYAKDLPAQVRWLLTSRPDHRVFNTLGPASLDLIADAPADANDVQEYAYRRLQSLAEPQRNSLATRVTQAGRGNFLYARYVLESLPKTINDREDLSELLLPTGLDDIYHQFLKRELERNEERWGERYRPVLGVLAVAQGSGLTRAQVANVTGLAQSRTDDILRTCAQYLDGPWPDGPFHFYHQSFRDYLLPRDHPLYPAEYQVYPVEAHAAIASFFLTSYLDDWQNCEEEYALYHTPTHLLEAIRPLLNDPTKRRQRMELVRSLVNLLTNPAYLTARLTLEKGSTFSLEQDYERASKKVLPDEDNKLLATYANALRRESHILRDRPTDYFVQVYNRLYRGDGGRVDQILASSKGIPSRPWLQALFPLPINAALQRTLSTYPRQYLSAVAVTADGGKIAGGNWDGTVWLWDFNSGQLLHVWEDLKGRVAVVRVGPDGRLVIAEDDRGVVVLWDAVKGQVLHMWQDLRASVQAMSTMPDGRLVITEGRDGAVVQREFTTGHVLRTWKETSDPSNVVASTPDGRRILIARSDGTVHVLDMDKEQLSPPLEDFTGADTITLSEDGGRVLAAINASVFGMEPAMLRLWDVDTGRLLDTWQGDTNLLNAVAVTEAGQMAIAGGGVGTIRLWELETRQELGSLSGHTGQLLSLGVTPDGRWLVSGGGEGTLRLWNLTVAREQPAQHGHIGAVRTVAITDDGQMTVSSGNDGKLLLWDLNTGQMASAQEAPAGGVSSIMLSRDQYVPGSGSGDGKLPLWDLKGVRVPEEWSSDGGGNISKLAITKDGSKLISVEGDGVLRVRDVSTGQLMRTFGQEPGHSVDTLAITPDDKAVFVGFSYGVVRAWDLNTGQVLCTLSGPKTTIITIVVTQDRRTALASDLDGIVWQWDLNTEQQIHMLRGHINWVRALAVTPDGSKVLSGGWDRTLRIWDLVSGNELSRYSWELPLTCCATWSNGHMMKVVVGDMQGNVLFFRLELA